MTLCQLSDHLEVVAHADEYRARNLYFGTEARCGPELFELLAAHEQPAAAESSELARTALEHRLITEAGQRAGEPPYLQKLEGTLSPFLRTAMKLDDAGFEQRFGAAEPGLPARLNATARMIEAAAQIFGGFLALQDHQRIHEENAVLFMNEGYTFRDPVVLVTVVFDFLWCMLERHLEPNSGGPTSALHRTAAVRPGVNLDYLQQPCTLHTTHQRLARMLELCPPDGRVLLLGDDDLVSVALAQRGGYPVDVVDIDRELLSFLSRTGGIAVRAHDLTHGLPQDFVGAYDVVASDPPYRLEPLHKFLECCREALAPRAASRLFLSCCPPLLEDGTRLFQYLEELGFHVERAERGFNRYPMPARLTRLGQVLAQAYRLPPGVLETVFSQPYLYGSLLECSLKGVRA